MPASLYPSCSMILAPNVTVAHKQGIIAILRRVVARCLAGLGENWKITHPIFYYHPSLHQDTIEQQSDLLLYF